MRTLLREGKMHIGFPSCDRILNSSMFIQKAEHLSSIHKAKDNLATDCRQLQVSFSKAFRPCRP